VARVDLDVPFSEKDEAKALGARWDPQAKVWYVPEGRDSAPLAKWIPQHPESALEPEPEYPLRSPYYFLVESKSDCWKCGSSTRVHAFMLPEEHEQFEYADETDEGFTLGSPRGYWERYGERGKVSNVYGLSPSVLAQLRSHTSGYKPAYSQQAGETYYMNHCEHCGAKLGDFYMHSEPGGAFFPTSPAEASIMVLHKVEAPFEANGSMGYASDDFFEFMQRKSGE
jgi:hypothetical protein